MKTYSALLIQYESPVVPLSEICEAYFDCDYKAAQRMHRDDKLPIPAFRTGSRQSPLMIKLQDLADHIDAQHSKAKAALKRMQAA